MTHVLTLISAHESASVTSELVARALEILPDAQTPIWLAPDEACDINFAPGPESDLSFLESTIRKATRNKPLDICILRAEQRRKKLLIADMDSTIIEQECIDEIGDFAGLKTKISSITERAMRGELAFDSALRERVALLAGLDENVLDQVIAERITLMPGAKTLVQTMKKNGAYCALVSGGFSFFTSRIAAMTGFDINQANRLEISNGKLSGLVSNPILGRDAKLRALEQYRQNKSLSLSDTLAVGDGANDLAMIGRAGLGVAYHAKPVVAAQADVRIDHGDLTALLFAQGYTKDEFVAG